MAIQRRPTRAADQALDKFVQGAPDANASSPRTRKRKAAVCIGVEPSLLARIDKAADTLGVSRAAFISMASSRMIEDEESRFVQSTAPANS